MLLREKIRIEFVNIQGCLPDILSNNILIYFMYTEKSEFSLYNPLGKDLFFKP